MVYLLCCVCGITNRWIVKRSNVKTLARIAYALGIIRVFKLNEISSHFKSILYLQASVAHLILPVVSKENCLNQNKTYVDLIVIPFSCSSFLVSMAHLSPAWWAEMNPARAKRESVKVVLPWSTCAITAMLRTFLGRSMAPLSCSMVKFT